jgi:hypothetical protein
MSYIQLLTNGLDQAEWVQKETKPELFQYNNYMDFAYCIDIDEEKFNLGLNYTNINDANKKLLDMINPIVNTLEVKYNKKIGMVYLLKLYPQRYPLRQYYNFEQYDNIVTSCYIPLITNSESAFCLDMSILYPNPGDELLITNDSMMSMYSSGQDPIVYLVVDLLDF